MTKIKLTIVCGTELAGKTTIAKENYSDRVYVGLGGFAYTKLSHETQIEAERLRMGAMETFFKAVEAKEDIVIDLGDNSIKDITSWFRYISGRDYHTELLIVRGVEHRILREVSPRDEGYSSNYRPNTKRVKKSFKNFEKLNSKLHTILEDFNIVRYSDV